MARTITIWKPQELTDIGSHFRDKKNDAPIKCAFSLKELCTPNCAACEIFGEHPKASCNRGEKDFQIGMIEG